MATRPLIFAAVLALATLAPAQNQNRPPLTAQEKEISTGLGQLRSLPDADWTKSVGELARKIQQLPATSGKAQLVSQIGNLVTEGDAGAPTLQAVADTMMDVLKASPEAGLYGKLASLAHYEGCQVSLDSPKYRDELAKLTAEDARRQNLNFTLKDLAGKEWTLQALRGKVVLVNFWATWCPPCRKEMPDMEALYQRFGSRGLVVLAITDEDAAKAQPFVAGKFTYPILLDQGRKVNESFGVQGIPRTFVYNREGKIAAQAIDRRTERQFLALLKQAGLE